LLNLKIDAKNIHAEYFTTPSQVHPDIPINAPAEIDLIVHINNKKHQFKMPGNKKILDFLIDKKMDPPYSCSSGACSTCMAKLLQGTVTMDVALALEPEEIEAGYILTCQARATTPIIEIQF
jgi:ring-1,2-phenylacetyl-CoA epoxidase subunit PaaE